jgi:hypothetical protein
VVLQVVVAVEVQERISSWTPLSAGTIASASGSVAVAVASVAAAAAADLCILRLADVADSHPAGVALQCLDLQVYGEAAARSTKPHLHHQCWCE